MNELDRPQQFPTRQTTIYWRKIGKIRLCSRAYLAVRGRRVVETISPFQNVEIRVIWWGEMRGGASTFLTRPDSRVMKPAALRSRCSSSFSFVQPFNLAAGGATSIHRDTCVIFFLNSIKFQRKLEPANALFSTPKFQSMAAECCAKPSINWPIRPLFSLFSSQLFDLIQTTRHLCPNQVSVSWTFLEPCDTEFTKKKKILIETPTGRPSIDFLAASIFTVSKQMATENFFFFFKN